MGKAGGRGGKAAGRGGKAAGRGGKAARGKGLQKSAAEKRREAGSEFLALMDLAEQGAPRDSYFSQIPNAETSGGRVSTLVRSASYSSLAPPGFLY